MMFKCGRMTARNLNSSLNKIVSLLLFNLILFYLILILIIFFLFNSIRHIINEDTNVYEYYDVYYCKQNFNCRFK